MLRSSGAISLRRALANRLGRMERTASFSVGLPVMDRVSTGGGMVCGAVHELLAPSEHPLPVSVAAVVARSVAAHRGGAIVWVDGEREIYPPALRKFGIGVDRVLLLRPGTRNEALWAVAECCGCSGVAVTVANIDRFSRVEARRLQLAAERGGGIGLLLRRYGSISSHYAAATRWLVTPRPGDMAVRRWDVHLLHGHGGQVGQSVVLEVCRETNHVRAFEAVADRPAAPQAAPIPA